MLWTDQEYHIAFGCVGGKLSHGNYYREMIISEVVFKRKKSRWRTSLCLPSCTPSWVHSGHFFLIVTYASSLFFSVSILHIHCLLSVHVYVCLPYWIRQCMNVGNRLMAFLHFSLFLSCTYIVCGSLFPPQITITCIPQFDCLTLCLTCCLSVCLFGWLSYLPCRLGCLTG